MLTGIAMAIMTDTAVDMLWVTMKWASKFKPQWRMEWSVGWKIVWRWRKWLIGCYVGCSAEKDVQPCLAMLIWNKNVKK
jgi:hypothetical protein